ncbi:MAG: replication endonuclease, partial [Moraxellaceae bacterium]|nr:replication endonuclease [Moraxellaceae bacterium]
MNISAFLNFPAAQSWNPIFTREQQRYLSRMVAPVAPLAGMLSKAFTETAKAAGYVEANRQIRELPKRLFRKELNLSWNDEELSRWCESRAQKALAYLRAAECTDRPFTVLRQVVAGKRLVARYGIEMPSLDDHGPLPVLRRLADAAWWRRQARKIQAREVEGLAIALGRMRRGREIYCSDESVKRRSAQRHRNRKYLENTEAENQAGQRYTLAELADLSVSNPRIRRGELMLRLNGFDEVAVLLGHIREVWTLTAPSRFHRWTTAGGTVRKNPRYDESTPRKAQQWLSKVFSRIRSALARHDVKLYGMRVVEANHDGTPHWHMAVF